MARIIQRKNSSRKEVITLAAARLFREKGYSATGMRDVAGQVGVEAASLYNHVSSKSELLQRICMSVAAEFTDQLTAVEADDKKSAVQKLEAVMRFHIRMWTERLDEVLVTTNESKYLDEPVLAQFLQERRVYVRRLETIVEAGIQSGQIRKLEPYVVVLNILSAVRGIEFWHRTRKNVTADALENHMVEALILGLKT